MDPCSLAGKYDAKSIGRQSIVAQPTSRGATQAPVQATGSAPGYVKVAERRTCPINDTPSRIAVVPVRAILKHVAVHIIKPPGAGQLFSPEVEFNRDQYAITE